MSRKGESYKDVVREYMESTGFAVKSDSSIEGHTADTIYVPIQGGGLGDEVWVEAKDTKLSLSNPQFRSEALHYLQAWLARPPSKRFELRIFVRELSAPKRWDRVFGDALEPEEALEWLEGASADSQPLPEKQDLLAFLASTTVSIGDRGAIQWATEQRTKANSSARSIVRVGERLRQDLEHCSKPIYDKSQFVAGLYRVDLPDSFRVLSIAPLATSTVVKRLHGKGRAPFWILRKGALLTLDVDGIEEYFSAVNGEFSEVWKREEAEMIDQDSVLQLVKDSVRLLLFKRSVKKNEGVYYFLADRNVAERRARIINSPRGRLTVARPYFTGSGRSGGPDAEDLLGDDGDLVYDVPRDVEEEDLNFVFHHGFTLRAARYWGEYFLQLNPAKTYTKDGSTPLDGEARARLDAKFRRPALNRADAQLKRLEKIAAYVFPTDAGAFGPSHWSHQFKFNGLAETAVPWSPVAPDELQRRLFSFGQEGDDP